MASVPRSALPLWTPDLPALDLLISIAELGSLGRAATVHQISQPSASARLARLERLVGAVLVRRGPRGSSLTLTGEALLAWARPVVDSARQLSEGIATLRGDRSASLRIAASLTVAEFMVPQWLQLLRGHHPDIGTAVHVVNSHDVVEQVKAGAVDVGFVETPAPPPGVHARWVGQDRLTLVAAHDSLLAAAGRPLRLSELVDEPLLLREPGSGTRDTFLFALNVEGGERSWLGHWIELGSTATIVATALAGGGVGVVSARAVAREIAEGTLVELRLEKLNLVRPLHAVWVGPRLGALAAELIEIAVGTSSNAAKPLGREGAPIGALTPRQAYTGRSEGLL